MGWRTCDTGVTSFYILHKFAQLWKESKSGIHDPSTSEREHVKRNLHRHQDDFVKHR